MFPEDSTTVRVSKRHKVRLRTLAAAQSKTSRTLLDEILTAYFKNINLDDSLKQLAKA